MLEAGDGAPLYIARRMIRFRLRGHRQRGSAGTRRRRGREGRGALIGMPEGNNALAQAAIYLATANAEERGLHAYSDAALMRIEKRPSRFRSISATRRRS